MKLLGCLSMFIDVYNDILYKFIVCDDGIFINPF